MGQCGQKTKRQEFLSWQTLIFYGFEGKSLMSTRYDATDHIPVIDSLHFGGS